MKRLLPIITLCLGLSATAGEQAMQLVGEARLKVLFWPVYHSRLYSTDGTYTPSKRPLRLEIRYLMDIESQDLVDRTALEWQAQQLRHPNQTQWLAALENIWPDVQKEDVISLHIDADQRSHFYFNGEHRGTIDDPQFGQRFLDIWLSPETTRPQLREQLLGQY